METLRLDPGTRLPSWLDLAAQLGVARGTVRSAYEKLSAAQLIAASRASGTHVAARPSVSVEDTRRYRFHKTTCSTQGAISMACLCRRHWKTSTATAFAKYLSDRFTDGKASSCFEFAVDCQNVSECSPAHHHRRLQQRPRTGTPCARLTSKTWIRIGYPSRRRTPNFSQNPVVLRHRCRVRPPLRHDVRVSRTSRRRSRLQFAARRLRLLDWPRSKWRVNELLLVLVQPLGIGIKGCQHGPRVRGFLGARSSAQPNLSVVPALSRDP